MEYHPIVAAELGSSRLEGAEPCKDIIESANRFALGEISEEEFTKYALEHRCW